MTDPMQRLDEIQNRQHARYRLRVLAGAKTSLVEGGSEDDVSELLAIAQEALRERDEAQAEVRRLRETLEEAYQLIGPLRERQGFIDYEDDVRQVLRAALEHTDQEKS